MTRTRLHDKTALTTLREWGDPINHRDSLRMALYWHARRAGRSAIIPPYQPPLYERSPRRLHAAIAVNDQRRVTTGPFRRWERDMVKVWDAEMALWNASRQAEDEAALRLYDIVTGKTPLPD